MSERLRECKIECPMYCLSEKGCVYEGKGEAEKIRPGETCLHQDFNISEYIKLWASGIAGDLSERGQ